MRKLLFLAAASTALLFTAFTSSTDKVTLKLRLAKGKTYSYDFSTNQVISTSYAGNKTVINQDVTFVYDMIVDNTDSKGNMTLSCIYRQIAMRSKQGGQSMMDYDSKTYDSTQHKDMMSDMMGKVFNGLINQKFTIDVSPEGKVTSVKGIDDIINSIIASVNGEPEFAEILRASLKATLSEESLASNFESSFNIYPKTPVGTGDTWTVDAKVGTQMMKMQTKNTYTVNAIEGNDIKLGIASVVNTVKDTTNATGTDFNLKGTQVGTINVNKDNGLATLVNMKQNLAGNMKTSGTTMPMDLKSTVTIRVTEK